MRLRWGAICAAAFVALTVPAVAAAQPAQQGPQAEMNAEAALEGWQQTAVRQDSVFTVGEGVATRKTAAGSELVFRGVGQVPADLADKGWNHVGDPDSAQGYLFDAYEQSGRSTKLFRATDPAGATADFVYTLEPGARFNNSWVAVTPDGQWMLNGEWDRMSRFLIFPTPLLNTAAAQPGPITRSGYLNLDKPVQNVQGCTFFDATTLLCTSDVPNGGGTTPTLLEVSWSGVLDGKDKSAMVRSVGTLPQLSVCHGTFESEGLDYDPASGNLTVVVNKPIPCKMQSSVYTFTRKNS
ncbi:hypothetical protein [Nocardia arthritidis]|uniref:Secreted protein n=1 Tax=Nocardia arthritidis TaxID=228602 RepID=A0A6G9YE47_9NOCA|nr:hypothetical protein [Nocardia arthritidis]QIS11501.1 hypothetical protein F5544_18135 [Nocardia arthritidis]